MIACLTESGSAKNARICTAQRGERALVDAVADDLEKAPLAARGVDRALRGRAAQVADVDDG